MKLTKERIIKLLEEGAVKESDGADWPYPKIEAQHIADALWPLIESSRAELVRKLEKLGASFRGFTGPAGDMSDELDALLKEDKEGM